MTHNATEWQITVKKVKVPKFLDKRVQLEFFGPHIFIISTIRYANKFILRNRMIQMLRNVYSSWDNLCSQMHNKENLIDLCCAKTVHGIACLYFFVLVSQCMTSCVALK